MCKKVLVNVTDDELKQEILESKDDLAIAIANDVPEKRVKALRKQVAESLASVPPAKTAAEIIKEEGEIRAAKEKREREAAVEKEVAKGPKFFLKDPVTNTVRELKRVNSSCDIHLLVIQ